MVNPETVAVSVPALVVASAHPILVPLQAPLRTSIMASNPVPPTTVTVCVVELATKLYQTSKALEDVNPEQVMEGMDWVAPELVPLVVTQEVLEVKGVAFAQSSFEGGGAFVRRQTF